MGTTEKGVRFVCNDEVDAAEISAALRRAENVKATVETSRATNSRTGEKEVTWFVDVLYFTE